MQLSRAGITLWLLLSALSLQAEDDLSKLREQFLTAEAALERGDLEQYRQARQSLDDYPLLPYLQYRHLRSRLDQRPRSAVEDFLQAEAGSYLAGRLARDWLRSLAEQEHWEDYRYYFPRLEENSTTLRCHYLWSRLKTGDESALGEVDKLWNVAWSQPDACDRLFRRWMETGEPGDDLAWQRHAKALAAGNLSLARYVAGKLPSDLRRLARLYRELHRRPGRLAETGRFSAQTPKMEQMILHGIQRLARRDPARAHELWQHYDARHFFSEQQRRDIRESLVTFLVVDGDLATAQKLLDDLEAIGSNRLVGWLVRDALRNRDWQRVYDALQLFPESQQQEKRWLYWRARALAQLDLEDPDYPDAQTLYANLALTRSYYGFLAADILGREYHLADRPVDPEPALLQQLASKPGLRRARELLRLDRRLPARREWLYATRQLDTRQRLAAGKLAARWEWHPKSIRAMIKAGYWDDLRLRFPLAYSEEISQAAERTRIDRTLLYAIARQESAFAADARSSAGAMGLMQLMPATARRTAQRLGVRYRYWDLIDPGRNIQLGSSYLDRLLEQFNGDRVLAAAAYNAGPRQVRQWLDGVEDALPHDIWIETIPYRETRRYVQNVLAFSVIYGYRMGRDTSLLREADNRGVSVLTLAGG